MILLPNLSRSRFLIRARLAISFDLKMQLSHKGQIKRISLKYMEALTWLANDDPSCWTHSITEVPNYHISDPIICVWIDTSTFYITKLIA